MGAGKAPCAAVAGAIAGDTRYALLLWRLCLMMLSYSVYEKKEKTKTKKIFIVYNPIMTQYEYTEFRRFKRVWFYWFFLKD